MIARVHDRHLMLLAAAALLILLWFLSAADPCLIAFARGDATGAANPIAITRCSADGVVVLTIGDLVVRLGLLFLLMGVFGFVGARWEPTRNAWIIALLAAMGALAAFASFLYIQAVFLPILDRPFSVFAAIAALLTTIFAALGARVGAGIAYRRMA